MSTEAAPPVDAAPPAAPPPTDAAPPVSEPPAAAPPPPVEAAPPPVQTEIPFDAYEPDEVTVNVYNELARVQQQNAALAQQMAEMRERAERADLERQDADLLGRRAELRARALAAIESGDERARAQLSWELSDIDSQLIARQQQRQIQSLQPKPQARTAPAPVNVWEAFRSANNISETEFRSMYDKLTQRRMRGPVEETPTLYAQLLREVRRPTAAAARPAPGMPKPAPMVEATGSTAPPKATTTSKYDKADLEDVAGRIFSGAVTADFLASKTGG